MHFYFPVTTTNGIIPSQSTITNATNHHHIINNHDTVSTNGTANNNNNNNNNTNSSSSTTIENSKILPVSDINSTNSKLNGNQTSTVTKMQSNDVNKENIPINSAVATAGATITPTTVNSVHGGVTAGAAAAISSSSFNRLPKDSGVSPTPLAQSNHSSTNANSSLTGGMQNLKNDSANQQIHSTLPKASINEDTCSDQAPSSLGLQSTEITISSANDAYQPQLNSITPILEIDSKENLIISDLNSKPTTTTTTIITNPNLNLNEIGGGGGAPVPKLPLGQTMSNNPQPSSIPTPIQSTSRALSGSSTTSSSKPHQRGITHIGSGIGTTTTTSTTAASNAIKLKKSDTVRG